MRFRNPFNWNLRFGTIPESFYEAMTYEEQIMWLYKAIQDIKQSSANYNYNLLENKPSINGVELIRGLNANGLGLQEKLIPGNGIIINGNVISATGGGGSGGTDNYNELVNKPSINGIELIGNKTFQDLGLNFPTKQVYKNVTEISGVEVSTGTLFDLTSTSVGSNIPQWTATSGAKAYLIPLASIPNFNGENVKFKVTGRCSNVMYFSSLGNPFYTINPSELLSKSAPNLQYTEQLIEETFFTITDPSNYYIIFQFTDTDFDEPILQVETTVIDTGSDYNDLDNKPSINGVPLVGNKTSADLHIEGGASVTNLTSNIVLAENSTLGLSTGFYNTGAYGVYYHEATADNLILNTDELFYFDSETQTLIMENKSYFYEGQDLFSGDWYIKEHNSITNEIVNNRSKIPTSQAVYNALQNISNFYSKLNYSLHLQSNGTILDDGNNPVTLATGFYKFINDKKIVIGQENYDVTANGIFYYDSTHKAFQFFIYSADDIYRYAYIGFKYKTNSWKPYTNQFVDTITSSGSPYYEDDNIPTNKAVINYVDNYIVASSGSNNGEFVTNIGNPITNKLYRIHFPSNSLSDNAKLSFNNGSTYYNILWNGEYESPMKSLYLSDKNIDLFFNGTNFIAINADTGWVTPTYASDHEASTLKVRRNGDVVTWCGQLASSNNLVTGNDKVVINDSCFAPPQSGNNYNINFLSVGSGSVSGKVNYNYIPSTGNVSFNVISISGNSTYIRGDITYQTK